MTTACSEECANKGFATVTRLMKLLFFIEYKWNYFSITSMKMNVLSRFVNPPR